jgi:hypothetical protein
MLKETTQNGTCPACGRPYIAAFQAEDAAGTSTRKIAVNCAHKTECSAAFQLGIPNGAEEKTFRLHTPLEWAELRKAEMPKSLTGAEFAQLALQNDVTGLSTIDVRRLLADNRRLRELVSGGGPHNGAARAVDGPERHKAEVERGDAAKPLTEDDLAILERLLREDATDPENASDAAQLALQLLAEVRRLREGAWLDQAALEIAGDPMCCDISSSSPRAMIATLRKHLKAKVERG